jgi:hypothetical protein
MAQQRKNHPAGGARVLDKCQAQLGFAGETGMPADLFHRLCGQIPALDQAANQFFV